MTFGRKYWFLGFSWTRALLQGGGFGASLLKRGWPFRVFCFLLTLSLKGSTYQKVKNGCCVHLVAAGGRLSESADRSRPGNVEISC